MGFLKSLGGSLLSKAKDATTNYIAKSEQRKVEVDLKADILRTFKKPELLSIADDYGIRLISPDNRDLTIEQLSKQLTISESEVSDYKLKLPPPEPRKASVSKPKTPKKTITHKPKETILESSLLSEAGEVSTKILDDFINTNDTETEDVESPPKPKPNSEVPWFVSYKPVGVLSSTPKDLEAEKLLSEWLTDNSTLWFLYYDKYFPSKWTFEAQAKSRKAKELTEQYRSKTGFFADITPEPEPELEVESEPELKPLNTVFEPVPTEKVKPPKNSSEFEKRVSHVLNGYYPEPQRNFSEDTMKKVILSLMKAHIPRDRVVEEKVTNEGRVDIVVDKKIGIELKIVDKYKTLQNLRGQIEDYSKVYPKLFCYIYKQGNVPEEKYTEFRQWIKKQKINCSVIIH